jgi:NAD(P)-dependent dehydrogenase (short-subunit alcohol dehydrogenase family)
MANRFQDKVVVITGASGNLGRQITQAYAREGARLALVDRQGKACDDAGIEAARCMTASADVTDIDSVNALIRQAVQRFGRIDILVHTVGGYDAGKPVHEAGIEVWDKMMNLNARSVYVTCGRVAAYMVENKIQGKIVAILARPAYQGVANAAAYSASKAAAQRVIESMAAELREYRINVNGIVPANIDTPAARETTPPEDYDKLVTPQDIANTILFLTSDDAKAIFGSSLEIYGVKG